MKAVILAAGKGAQYYRENAEPMQVKAYFYEIQNILRSLKM